AHPLEEIGVRVVRADVVVRVVLDGREAGDAEPGEAQVVGAADAVDDVAYGAEVRERREPGVENPLGRLVLLHIEAVRLAGAGIVVEIDGDAVARGLVLLAREVAFGVGAGAEQPLFLGAPERDAYGAARLDAERGEYAHRLHRGGHAVGVVGRAGSGVPGIE